MITYIKNLIIIALFLCSFTIHAYGATVPAASASYSDVASAVSIAQPRDTVVVPPGTAIWDSTLVVTKGIVLKSAIIGNTVITAGGSSTLIKYQPDNPSLNETFRLTGFTLDGNLTAKTILYVANPSHTAILTKIRIDHNRIINSSTGASDQGIYFLGMIYGVVDSNQIENNATAFRILGDNNYSWNDTLSLGSANSLYIENNNISKITAVNGGYVILSGWGARFVFRYNTVDVTGVGDPVFDAHGNLGGGTSPNCDWGNVGGVRGVVTTEMYENTITNFNRSNGKFFDVRGGTGLLFNNASTGTISGCNTAIRVREEDDDAIGSCYPLKTTYPGYDPVKDTYIWNNTNNGSAMCFINSDPSTFIFDQHDVWSDVKVWNGGVNTYFTKGLSSGRSGTCTDKDVYWETDNRKLYRCVGTDNWTFIYTPHTYPHPFTITPAAPTNLGVK